jgi:hypothetical protein
MGCVVVLVNLVPSECAVVAAGLASPPPPQPITEVLLPPPTVPSLAVGDVCPEPSTKDTLLTSEIQLHIAINVVSRLNAVEEARSLLVE